MNGDPPRAKWQRKSSFPIQDRMADVIQKTIAATDKQIEVYRRKLRKMQLGS